jgi:hypothetical protein
VFRAAADVFRCQMMSWFTLPNSDVPVCGLETYEDGAADSDDFYVKKDDIKSAKAEWMVVIL